MASDVDHTLCVLAVHFHNTEEVERFVEHVLGLPVPAGWRVVISLADNSRDWPSADVDNDRLMVSVPESNLGYLNGCAFALSAWMAHEEAAPDWVVVANTDLTFDRGAFLDLISTHWPEEVAAVAPRIQTHTGTDQNPFLASRPSRLRLRLLQSTFSGRAWRFPLVRLLQSPAYGRWKWLKSSLWRMRSGGRRETVLAPAIDRHASQRIYAPHGSVVFLTSAFFESGCSLEMPWFMFGEEIHLAEQIRRAGLRVVWVPAICVDHLQASATSRVPYERQLEWRADSLRHLVSLYFTGTHSGTRME